MRVNGNEVTLTKRELEECIIECSAKVTSKVVDDDDPLFIMLQGLITAKVVDEVTKKIFGEEK